MLKLIYDQIGGDLCNMKSKFRCTGQQTLIWNVPSLTKHFELVMIFCVIHSYTYINSRLFPMEVGKNYTTPLSTILTYSSHLFHIHTSDHTRTPDASTSQLTFLKNLINKVNVSPPRKTPPTVTSHICLVRHKNLKIVLNK